MGMTVMGTKDLGTKAMETKASKRMKASKGTKQGVEGNEDVEGFLSASKGSEGENKLPIEDSFNAFSFPYFLQVEPRKILASIMIWLTGMEFILLVVASSIITSSSTAQDS